MGFKAGDTVFIVESNRFIREAEVRSCTGGIYLIKFKDNGGGIKLKEHRLFATKEEAEASIPKAKRSIDRHMNKEEREMTDFETIARNNHRSGMNCAMAVYNALSTVNVNKTVPPMPRAEGGKCGTVLAAEQIIREMGGTSDMSDQGRHIFYEFLCKCDLFTSRFKVPRLTGIFTEER